MLKIVEGSQYWYHKKPENLYLNKEKKRVWKRTEQIWNVYKWNNPERILWYTKILTYHFNGFMLTKRLM